MLFFLLFYFILRYFSFYFFWSTITLKISYSSITCTNYQATWPSHPLQVFMDNVA